MCYLSTKGNLDLEADKPGDIWLTYTSRHILIFDVKIYANLRIDFPFISWVSNIQVVVFRPEHQVFQRGIACPLSSSLVGGVRQQS